MNFKHKSQATIAVISIVSLLIPHIAYAVGSSGFENASYSARSLGQSNAVVARPQDPDTVVFNPAGIPDLPGVQIGGNLEAIHVVTWHKSSVSHNTATSTSPLALVPTGYATYNLGERFDNRVGVGLGFNFPFGVSNRYPSHSEMARYAGYKNSIKLGALTMASGVKLHEKFSIGGGAVYYKVFQYDQSFNYPNGAVMTPATPGAFHDGKVQTYQQGDAWGWNAGALLKPTEQHQIGVSYRSQVTIPTNGRAVVTGLEGIPGVGSACTLQGFDTCPYWESGIHSDIPLPQNITVGYAYIPSEKWSAEIDLGWTGWSVFADQDVSVDRPNAVTQSLGRVPRNYHNTWSVNAGGHYKMNEKIDLLGGMWLYSAASPTENFDAVIPDSNRLGLSSGFTYSLTKSLDITTIGFVSFFERRSISNREYFAKNRVSLDGEYTSISYGLMSGLTYRFGEGAVKATNEPKVASTPKLASSAIVSQAGNLA